jgi:hypothetical protein
MKTVTSHSFNTQYKNNAKLFDTEYKEVCGIKFHDFSYASYDERTGKGIAQPVAGSIMNVVGKKYVTGALDALNSNDANVKKEFDQMNKLLSMMWVNWNGAEIEKGNWSNGSNVIISTTPEFLLIFNNVVSTVYEKVVVENNISNRIVRSKVKVVNINSNITNPTPGDNNFNNYEIWDVIYKNTSSSAEYEITFKNGAQIASSEISGGAVMKIPTGSEDLVVVVPPNGYGEINYLRLDDGNTKTVWVRGV